MHFKIKRFLYWHLPVMLCLIYFHCTLCRFLKLSSPRNWNITLRFSRSYRKFLLKTSWLGQIHIWLTRYLYFLFINCITLFPIIPEVAFGCKISNCSRFTKNKQQEGQAKSFPKRKLLLKIDNETFNHFVRWIFTSVYALIRQSDVIFVLACQWPFLVALWFYKQSIIPLSGNL